MISDRRSWACVLFLCVCSFGLPAAGARLQVPDHLCSEAKLLDKARFATWLLTKYKIRHETLEVPTIGTPDKVRVPALSDIGFCDKYKSCDGDGPRLYQAQIDTLEFLAQPGPDYKVDTSPDLPHRPYRSKERPFTLGEFFSQTPEYVRVSCLTKAEEPPAKPSVWRTVADYVRVRGTVEDLRISRNDAAAFQRTRFATVGITDKKHEAGPTFEISGAIGIANIGHISKTTIEEDETGSQRIEPGTMTSWSALPFLQYERRYTSGDGRNDSGVYNVGIGALAAATFLFGDVGGEGRRRDLFAHDLTVYPLFTKDPNKNSELLSIKAVYELTPPWPYFRAYSKLGPFEARAFMQLRGSLGEVLRDGSNNDLDDQNEFARFGGRVGLSLIGDDKLIPSNFVLSAWYQYLDVLKGKFGHIERFEATLDFVFPEQELFSLELKYLDGRVEETLEKETLWHVGVGVRF